MPSTVGAFEETVAHERVDVWERSFEIDAESCNEVDRLALAITGLGASVRILFRKVRTRAAAAAAAAAAAGMHT